MAQTKENMLKVPNIIKLPLSNPKGSMMVWVASGVGKLVLIDGKMTNLSTKTSSNKVFSLELKN